MRFEKPLFLLSAFGSIDIEVANACLTEWKHKMGPCERVKTKFWCHGLWYHDELGAVTVATSLMTGTIGGGHGLPLGRDNTIELARLCESRKGDSDTNTIWLEQEVVCALIGYLRKAQDEYDFKREEEM